MSNTKSLTSDLKTHARKLGFSHVGVAPAAAPTGLARFHEWLDRGYAGQMHFLADRRDAYRHPRHVMDGTRSVVMLTLNYRTENPQPREAGQGRISCYAWGESDYHDVVHGRLKSLKSFMAQRAPKAAVRGVVDTAPLLERDFARIAGIGWIGKNAFLLSRSAGSWFFLAALLTDCELEYDRPFQADHCGTCTACLDACPTRAFPQPYVLDATRCISYLTIELRDAIPDSHRPHVGDWLFGCDICQDVCPWNHRAPRSEEATFRPRTDSDPIDLLALFDLDDAAFRQRFRRTPLWRARRRGILRNAAIALGNQRPPHAIAALTKGLNDSESLVREACAWALGRCQTPTAADALKARKSIETDSEVRKRIAQVLCPSIQNP